MHVRRAIGLAVGLAVVFAPALAHAWQEVHQTGDDETVRVDPNGVATVEHELHWRVVRGPIRSIDLANVTSNAVIEPGVLVTAGAGRTLEGLAVRRDDGTVRVTFDESSGLKRGTFTFDVRWRVDLVAAGALSRDSAAWRLVLSAPVAHDGFDGARTVVDLPAAAGAPYPINAETGVLDDAAVATLRRGVERDELELVRPHIARGESATWTVRVDTRALPLAGAQQPHAERHVSPPPQEPNRVRFALQAVCVSALGLVFGLLVVHKARAFSVACVARGGRAVGLLPLPPAARATLGGIALSAAIGLEIAGETTLGAACVSFALLAAALRPARVAPPVRPPGQWRALRPEFAFASTTPEGHWLDLDSWAGKVTTLFGLAALVAVAIVAQRFDGAGAWLVALDGVALAPLTVTGRASQLPPHGAQSVAPWLSRAFRLLRAVPSLRVAPWARIVTDGITTDELRLLVLPRVAMPGVIGLEVGLVWSSTPVGWAATPEVLARVVEGSAAAAKLLRVAPQVRMTVGRSPQERVARMLPRMPTRSSTVALVRGLAEALMDRRAASPLWCALAPPPSGLRSTDVLNIRSPEGSGLIREHRCA